MIPKIIHQIWLQGEDKIPPELSEHYASCKRINNDFEHIFWDETKIKKLFKDTYNDKYTELYDSYKHFAQKADLARYVILYTYGGIYLDMDTLCKKNLSIFLNHNFFTTIYGDYYYKIYKRYHNAVIGSKPKHPVFLVMFKNIYARRKYSNMITYSTGTRLFYDSVQEYLKNNPNDITLIDPKYLNPCTILDGPDCAKTCQDCYIAHTSNSSWSIPLKIIKFISSNKNKILYIVFVFIIYILYVILSKKIK